MRNALIPDEAPSLAVRVLPGYSVQTHDDLAPTVPELFVGGDTIPNLEADLAHRLVAAGVVEHV